MSIVLSLAQLRQLRLYNQMLTESCRPSSAAQAVSRLCALQSQEWPSAQLAIQARARGITQTDVIQAREVESAFVMTWSLRGTLHLVAAEDIHWQLALCGPGAIRGTRRRYEQLGLSETIREEALPAIESILNSEGALTRPELARALASRGIPVEGQAIHHLVRFAALRGLVCLGPERGGDLTYALLDDWLPADAAEATPEDPLAHFARRYLEVYAPAAAADFARWSGLSKAQVRAAWGTIAAECVTVAILAGEAQMLKAQLDQLDVDQGEPSVRFLPRYDNYLLGYESRAFMVADAYAKQVHPGGGLIRACVVINGEAKANWKLEKRRAGVRVVLSPFEALDRSVLPFREAEAASLGRFLNTNAELRIEGG
ncbi:MAG: winged helix DNA-binding domain-containing protein [Chloroflexi bacterium]|nr:winged helix DNA-binding domain-containing protein [Chloroflexota bacterium]